MAIKPRFLVDKSALARMSLEQVGARLAPLIRAGRVLTCSIVDLEVLFSARSPEHYRAVRWERAAAFPLARIDQATLDRAVEVQAMLAERSEHRGASVPDLIVAAAAERAEATVLHYDADFELIASITGQSVEWVVDRGSIS